jgi:hypothetical protein
MTTETDYWHRLRKKLKGQVYTWKINASYVKGVPDCWMSGLNQDLWVENKRMSAAQPPVSLDLTDHKKYLTLHQQRWLKERYEEGRNVAVVVFGKPGHLYLEDLEWQTPISRLNYLDQAMTMDELAQHIVAILGEIGVK